MRHVSDLLHRPRAFTSFVQLHASLNLSASGDAVHAVHKESTRLHCTALPAVLSHACARQVASTHNPMN